MFESVLILCRGGWWVGVNHDNKANSAELGNLKGISVRYVPLCPSPFGRLGEPAHSQGHITNLFVSSLMFVSKCLCGTRTSFCVGDEHLYIHTGHSALYTYWLLTPFLPFSAWNITNQLYWSRRLVCTIHGGVRKRSWPLLTILSSSSSRFFLPSIAFHPLQGYPGSWYSVYNLILTSLDIKYIFVK